MMPQVRPAEPEVLARGETKWTERWATRCQSPGAEFTWPTVDGLPLNQLLLPALQYMSGHLAPHPSASPHDQRRAQLTIDLFRLNMGDIPGVRMSVVRKLRQHPDLDAAEEACRYLAALR